MTSRQNQCHEQFLRIGASVSTTPNGKKMIARVAEAIQVLGKTQQDVTDIKKFKTIIVALLQTYKHESNISRFLPIHTLRQLKKHKTITDDTLKSLRPFLNKLARVKLQKKMDMDSLTNALDKL